MYPEPFASGETFEYVKTTTILPAVTATPYNAVMPTFTPQMGMGPMGYPPVYPPPYPPAFGPGYGPGYPPPGVIYQNQTIANQNAYASGATTALALCCCLELLCCLWL